MVKENRVEVMKLVANDLAVVHQLKIPLSRVVEFQ
jgi:hypothetical protein